MDFARVLGVEAQDDQRVAARAHAVEDRGGVEGAAAGHHSELEGHERGLFAREQRQPRILAEHVAVGVLDAVHDVPAGGRVDAGLEDAEGLGKMGWAHGPDHLGHQAAGDEHEGDTAEAGLAGEVGPHEAEEHGADGGGFEEVVVGGADAAAGEKDGAGDEEVEKQQTGGTVEGGPDGGDRGDGEVGGPELERAGVSRDPEEGAELLPGPCLAHRGGGVEVELVEEAAARCEDGRCNEKEDDEDLDGEGARRPPEAPLLCVVEEGGGHRGDGGSAGEWSQGEDGDAGGSAAAGEEIEAGHGEGEGEHVDAHEGGPYHEVGHGEDESAGEEGGECVSGPVPDYQGREDRDGDCGRQGEKPPEEEAGAGQYDAEGGEQVVEGQVAGDEVGGPVNGGIHVTALGNAECDLEDGAFAVVELIWEGDGLVCVQEEDENVEGECGAEDRADDGQEGAALRAALFSGRRCAGRGHGEAAGRMRTRRPSILSRPSAKSWMALA